MIRIKALKKTYRMGAVTSTVIDALDLVIEEGEFIAVVGPSGSGKSTLLNLIGCLDKPQSGTIEINGVDVTRLSRKEALAFRAKHLGFIFQDFNLIEAFTVFENIAFPLTTILKQKNVDAKVHEVLEAIGMIEHKDKYPDQLSGGQKQRVAVARALVVEPAIILADEPTANLDSVSAHKVIELMKDMQARFNTTFIFSTHDTKIMQEAKRIVTLEDGHIIKDTGVRA